MTVSSKYEAHPNNGLYGTFEGVLQRICNYVEIIANVSLEGVDTMNLLIRVKVKKSMKDVIVKREGKLSPRSILEACVAVGFQPPPKEQTEDLLDYFRTFEPKLTMIQPVKHGWMGPEGQYYITPDSRILAAPGADPSGVYSPPVIEGIPQVLGGSLTGWKKFVAVPALHSQNMMFCIALGFAAPLLRFADVENGIFHFYYDTSIGKTLLAIAGQSVNELCHRENVNRWNATDTAAEELFARYHDRLTHLDDTSTLSAHGEARKEAEEIASKMKRTAYLFGNGTPKRRANSYTKRNNMPTISWRSLCVSTGEHSLSKWAQLAGRRRWGGEEVRMVEISALENETYGIFRSLPEGVTSIQLHNQIAAACRKHHGHAGEAFILEVMQRVSDDRVAFMKTLNQSMEWFYAEANVSTKSKERRIAKRFALAFAAANLAIKAKILPWSKVETFEAIKHAYDSAKTDQADEHNAQQDEAEHNKKVRRLWKRVRQHLATSPDVIDLSKVVSAPPNAHIIIKDDPDLGRYFAVVPDTLKYIADDDDLFPEMMDYLESREVLIRNGDNRTRQIQVPGIKERKRYFCFAADAVEMQ